MFDSTAAGNFANLNTNLATATTFASITFDSANNIAKNYHIGGTRTITVDGSLAGVKQITASNIGFGGFEFVDFPVILKPPMNIVANGPSGVLQFTNTVQLQGSVGLTGTGQLLITGTISESGGSYGLTKLGSGQAELSTPAGNASYTGPTAVNAGTLAITGLSIASSSGVTVNSGGTFIVQNGGTAPSITSNGGTVSAGTTGTPIANSGTLTLDSASTFLFMAGTFVTNYATNFNVTGGVNLGGSSFAIDPNEFCGGFGFFPAPADAFIVINNISPGAVNGQFNGMPEGILINVCGAAYRLSYFGGTGNNDVTLTYAAATYTGNGLPSVAAVPVLSPATLALMVGMLLLSAAAALRRRM